jgi:hypothetical protein
MNHRLPRWCIRVAVLALVACGPGGGAQDAAATVDADQSDAGPAFVGAVYAHTGTALYEIDPHTLTVSYVGDFAFPRADERMTDIALDQNAAMVGISFTAVYAVDKETASCTRLATVDRPFNGLSFIAASETDSGTEILVGVAQDGTVYQIDQTTGQSTAIGSYGEKIWSSGDLVSVTGFGTVATVKRCDDCPEEDCLECVGSLPDWLARVDPNTGAATLIGDTGMIDIWGLGYWKGQVYGFANGGQFVLIDVRTGAASVMQRAGVSWWGAGVTTSAPVIE